MRRGSHPPKHVVVASRNLTTVDDIHAAWPIIKTIPDFPQFRGFKVVQDFYHQQYMAEVLLWVVRRPKTGTPQRCLSTEGRGRPH